MEHEKYVCVYLKIKFYADLLYTHCTYIRDVSFTFRFDITSYIDKNTRNTASDARANGAQ